VRSGKDKRKTEKNKKEEEEDERGPAFFLFDKVINFERQ